MPYYGPLPDTLIVDGTDLQSLDGITVRDFSELYAPGRRRGAHDVIPGKDGQLGAPLPLDAYSFSVPITVDGGTSTDRTVRRAAMNARLRSAFNDIAGVTAGGLVTLTRRLAKVGGGYDEHTAAGSFVGLNTFALLNPDTGDTDLEFINLDGQWWSGTAWVLP